MKGTGSCLMVIVLHLFSAVSVASSQKIMPTPQNGTPWRHQNLSSPIQLIPSGSGHSTSTQVNLPHQCTEAPRQSFSTEGQQLWELFRSSKVHDRAANTRTKSILEGSTLPVEKPYQLDNANHIINNRPNIPAFSLLSISNSSDITSIDGQGNISGGEPLPKTCENENYYIPEDKADHNKLHCDQPTLLKRENVRDEQTCQQPSFTNLSTKAEDAYSKILTPVEQQLSSLGSSLNIQSTSKKTKTSQEVVYTIHCVKCKYQLCTAGDLRSLGSKVIVLCDSYRDKVIIKEKVKPTQTRPGR